MIIKKILYILPLMIIALAFSVNAANDVDLELVDPPDTVYNNTHTNVTFKWNATKYGDGNLTNCSIWTNTTGTWANSSRVNVNPHNNTLYESYVIFSAEDQTIIWNLVCTNNTGQPGETLMNATNRTLYVNYNSPILSLATDPSDFLSSNISFGYIPSDWFLSRCDLYIDGLLDQTNTPSTGTLKTTAVKNTFTKLYTTNTISNFYISCNDTGGLRTTTGSEEFRVVLTTGEPIVIGGGGGAPGVIADLQAITGGLMTEKAKGFLQKYFVWVIVILIALVVFWKPIKKLF